MNNPTITRTEVQTLIDAGAVTVVEALPAEYYEQGHLPGAINIPHTEVRDLAPALLPDVRDYEPAMALFGGEDGLEIIDRLLARLPARLAPGGTFIVEFGYGQEDSVRASAAREGWDVRRVLDDLQGIARSAVLGR